MSYGVRWVSTDGKTSHWTAPFATREDAESHAALRQMANGLSYTVEEIGLSPIEAKPQPRTKMSYRVRFTFPNGTTGVWALTYQTCEAAQHAVREREADTGIAYTVEEVPEPGSTAAHHVEILRERVKRLEEVQKAIHRDLALALQIGDAMREAMRTGEWRAGHDKSMANSAIAGWDRWKPSLAATLQGTAKASEVPGEGGDSDRRRLEALERWLRGNTYRMVYFSTRGVMVAGSDSIGDDDMEAPTLAALADKLMEMEGKPMEQP